MSGAAASTRLLLRRQLGVAAWALGIVAIALPVGVVLVDSFTTVEISVVQFARQAFVWFPFSMAVITATTFVPVHVAAGLTRRALGRASLAVAGVMATLYTLALTGALQVERAVYGARGWSQRIVDEAAVFTDTSQVGLILLDLGLLLTAAQLCGLLVGIVYLRVGGWWGTLALPLTVGPVLVVTPMLTTSVLDPLSMPVRALLGAVLLALTAAAYLAVLHRTPVRQATT